MVTTLKPRVQTQRTERVAPAPAANSTPRTRGRAWMETRAKWLRANPLCVPCEAEGRPTHATQVDHVVPLWRGGADDPSNYQSICDRCHDEKTRREASERAVGEPRSQWDGLLERR